MNGDRAEVIANAKAKFGLIIDKLAIKHSLFGESVTTHLIKDANLCDIDDNLFFTVRDWFERNGWLLSRQMLLKVYNVVIHYYISPIELLQLASAFHTTRIANLASIMSSGLRPATKDTGNFDRLDSIGNIYVVTELGSPDDHANEILGTAHWWAEFFATDNRHHDKDWRILKLSLSGVADMICFKDIFSRTGVVLRPRQGIEPIRIKRIA